MGNIYDELIDVEASLIEMGMSRVEARIEAAHYRVEERNTVYDVLCECNCEAI